MLKKTIFGRLLTMNAGPLKASKLAVWRGAVATWCFFIISGIVQAQERKCATAEAVKAAILKNPKLQQKLEEIESKAYDDRYRLRGRLSVNLTPRNPLANNDRSAAVVTIPVVVHIVLTDPSVVTDAQVLSQIKVLNEDYSASNADTAKIPAVWKPLIGNTQMQFCLARRTPEGDPATGIVRVATNQSSFDVTNAGASVKHASSGGDDAWDTQKYLNIWVCNLIGGALGVATPPGIFPDNEQGIVIQYTAFGTTGNLQSGFNKGRTVTHEIGHFFSLRHTWGDVIASNAAGCGDDGVADTPPESKPAYSCPGFPLTDVCSPNAPGVMFMNYMDYANDSCMHLFTQGQSNRMQNILYSTRASLLNSDGCVPVVLQNRDAAVFSVLNPQGKICDNNLQPLVVIKNKGIDTLTSVKINYRIDNGPVNTVNWTGQLPTSAKVTVMLPTVSTTTGTHVLTAFTSQPNGGVDQQPVNDTARSGYQLDPQAVTPFLEGFEDPLFPPSGWALRNPDKSYTWQRTTVAAKSGIASIVMRNLAYAQNGPMDDLLSPVFNLTNTDSAFLFFQVAAAVQSDPNGNNTYWDTLEVLISRDCGVTFTSLYKKWGKNLITRNSPLATEFVPAPNEWRRDSIDLTPYVNKGNFQLVFRNITNYENNIYLDDINVLTKKINPNLKREGILVTPNPVSDQLSVTFLEIGPNLVSVEVYNTLGQLIARKRPSAALNNRLLFDLANEPNGIYFVKILYTNRKITKKIIKLK